MAHLSWTKTFWYKPLLLLLSTCWPFSLCKILKTSCCRSRVTRMHHFWAQNAPFAPIFGRENYWYHSHLPISPFPCAKLKKNSSNGSRVMRMHNFCAQNDPFLQMRSFFRTPVNEPCFFHSCLSTCQKSKSDLNLLLKYWRLNNTEISLAEIHFWL